MKPVLNGTPTNLVSTTSRILAAVLEADPSQEQSSICVMLGHDEDPQHAIVSFLVGPDSSWASGCWVYASRKLAYLIANPDAVTSFEGANPDEGLYGGGARIKKLLMCVSGLSAEGDLVTGLLTLICLGEISTDEAREVVANVSTSCLKLFNKAHELVANDIPRHRCEECDSMNTTYRFLGAGYGGLVRERITCHECGHQDTYGD